MIKRFYTVDLERRLRLFVVVVLIPAACVCALMKLQQGMIFVLLAPFIALFFYPELLAGAATYLLLFKRDEAARAICQHGLALFPTSEGLLSAMSLVLFRSNRYQEAETEMTKVLAINPSAGLYLINRAGARCHLAKYEEAEEDANRAIERLPKHYAAYLNRASARLGQQNYEGCLEDCQHIQRLGKNTAAARMLTIESYLMTGRLAEAEALTSDIGNNVKPEPFDALSFALLHYCRNEYVETLQACAQVSDKEPLAYQFIFLQAGSYYGLNEGSLAMESAARGIALNPLLEECHLLRAFVLADAGHLDAAIAECESMPVACSRSSMTRDAQTFVFWRQEEWDKMLDASRQSIERCPTLAFSHAMQSLALAGLERLEEALEVGHKATRIQPLQTIGWCSLANAYLKNNEVAEAIKCLNTALAADSHNRLCYQLRAQAHLLAGDQTRATQDQGKYDELQAKFVANLHSPKI